MRTSLAHIVYTQLMSQWVLNGSVAVTPASGNDWNLSSHLISRKSATYVHVQVCISVSACGWKPQEVGVSCRPSLGQGARRAPAGLRGDRQLPAQSTGRLLKGR